MARSEDATDTASTAAVRDFALRYPDVEVVGVCVNRAFKAGGKSFLFLGLNDREYHLRLRLGTSLPEAERLASEQPNSYDVGKFGWTKVTFPLAKKAPLRRLERWIDESFRLLVHKRIVATLPASGPPSGPSM